MEVVGDCGSKSSLLFILFFPYFVIDQTVMTDIFLHHFTRQKHQYPAIEVNHVSREGASRGRRT